MVNRRLNGLIATSLLALLATAPGVLAQEAKTEPEKPAAAAPKADLTPRFGPRGLRIKPPPGAEFGDGNVVPGPFNVPGWPEAKASKPLLPIADAEIAATVPMLEGSFASDAVAGSTGDVPALVYGGGRVDIEGLDNAVYFEIARADAPWKPYRQGIFHLYKAGANLRLRVFAFGGLPSFPDSVVGMWLAPEIFPDLSVSKLIPLADIPLSKAEGGLKGQTAARFPVMMGGAVEAEMALGLSQGQITLADRGYDASGKQVSGLAADKSVVFKSAPSKMRVTKREDGLFIIDLVPPSAGGLAAQADANARIAVHYTGWLYTDGWKFASSRDARWDGTPGEPQVFNMQAKLLSGWSKGMPGMTKGCIRRLIVPSGMAFHTTGSQPWRVPPETPVIFDVECLWVEEKAAEAPAGTPPTPAGDKAADAAKQPEGAGKTPEK